MAKESIAAREVRWMGVVIGAFVSLIGAALALASVATVGEYELAAFKGPAQPTDAMLWIITGTELALGVPILLYGRSIVRRSLTDAVVTSTVAFTPGGAQRTLAWIAAVFSAFMVLGSIGMFVAAMVRGRFDPGALYFGALFALVFIAAVRYLPKTKM